MRIACILAGQLRTFDNPYVVRSWKKFKETFNAEIFGCFWSNRGNSAYGSIPVEHDVNQVLKEDYVKSILNTDYVKLYDYDNFLSNIDYNYKCFLGQELSQCIIPHSYLRYEAWQLYLKFKELIDADVFIITRPDLIFLRNINFECLDMNFLWHQNTQVYHPDRVYDMMMVSSEKNTETLCSFFNDIETSLESIRRPLHNDLKMLDSCRVYYNYLNMKGVEVKSLDYLHADCFRVNKDIENYSNAYLSGEELWGTKL